LNHTAQEKKQKNPENFPLQNAMWMQRIGDRIKLAKIDENISEADREKKINNIWRE